MNTKQEQQLKQIDKELESRGMNVGTVGVLPRLPYESITVSFDRDVPIPSWMTCINNARHDIGRFGIKLTAQYMLAKLRECGMHGIAIHSNRDELDPQFGEFVAKARLLKHIKKMEARKRE